MIFSCTNNVWKYVRWWHFALVFCGDIIALGRTSRSPHPNWIRLQHSNSGVLALQAPIDTRRKWRQSGFDSLSNSGQVICEVSPSGLVLQSCVLGPKLGLESKLRPNVCGFWTRLEFGGLGTNLNVPAYTFRLESIVAPKNLRRQKDCTSQSHFPWTTPRHAWMVLARRWSCMTLASLFTTSIEVSGGFLWRAFLYAYKISWSAKVYFN